MSWINKYWRLLWVNTIPESKCGALSGPISVGIGIEFGSKLLRSVILPLWGMCATKNVVWVLKHTLTVIVLWTVCSL